MIKKKTIMAEEISIMLSPGGIYKIRLNAPDTPQKIT
tara:strand:+ start:6522 stop:6632 length:111 start_codon:yes stop_codon:yes gene_type:complete